MVVSPEGAVGGDSSNFNFLWEQWSYIATVFSVFIIGGLIPLYNLLNNRIKEMRVIRKNKDETRIKKLASEVSTTLENKLNTHIDSQTKANDAMIKTLNSLNKKLDQSYKENKACLNTVRVLTKDFHDFKNKQVSVNSKVDYMDSIFRDNISFNFSGNNTNNAPNNKSK